MHLHRFVSHAAKSMGVALVLGALLGSVSVWGQSTMSSTNGKLVAYTGPDKILAIDAAKKTVDVSLVGAEGKVGYGMNFNALAKGSMVIRVPVGWTVTVSLVVDSTLKHSALIVPWEQREGYEFTPAFPGSDPKDYGVGFGKGSPKDEYSFKADQTGQYAIVCGVPGHAEAGMWDEFDVVADLANPEVLLRC